MNENLYDSLEKCLRNMFFLGCHDNFFTFQFSCFTKHSLIIIFSLSFYRVLLSTTFITDVQSEKKLVVTALLFDLLFKTSSVN